MKSVPIDSSVTKMQLSVSSMTASASPLTITSCSQHSLHRRHLQIAFEFGSIGGKEQLLSFIQVGLLDTAIILSGLRFFTKVKMSDRVKPEDELFPYFNVDEMLVVEELYKEAVENTGRKLIIFNGELDRIRSGYYPPFFYPKLAAPSQNLFLKMETLYYIHNFKGQNGGTLFRCYPGPSKVLRKFGNKRTCIHQQDTMPSLKEVSLNILPSS
ncbi:hypothetical protein AKJ16_DCAP26953 [Drosera capensis]